MNGGIGFISRFGFKYEFGVLLEISIIISVYVLIVDDLYIELFSKRKCFCESDEVVFFF